MPNILQWREQSEGSRYPFSDNAPLNNGTVEIPAGFLVDAQVVAPQASSGEVYLRKLNLTGTLLTGTLTCDSLDLATFSIAGNLPGGSPIPLGSPGGTACGLLVTGSRWGEILRGLPQGDVVFLPEQTPIAPGCILKFPIDVLTGLEVDSVVFSGKIALLEGTGIVLVKTPDGVRIDAIGSNQLTEECCNETGSPLRGINAAVADQYGNLGLVLAPFGEPKQPGDLRQVLRINTIANGIQLSLSK